MSLLARSPTGAIFKDLGNTKEVSQKVERLFDAQQSHVKVWREIKKYQLPFIGKLNDTNGKAIDYDTSHLLDSYASHCNDIFASGVMSGLTPPSRQWFKLTLANSGLQANHEMSAVLDQRHEIMQAIFGKSNFYIGCYQAYQELAYGQAAMGIFRDTRTGIRVEQFTIGTYAMSVGGNGIVDTFTVKRAMTLMQIAEQFSVESMPPGMQDLLRNHTYSADTYTVYWLVEPNRDYVNGKIGKRHMKYRSYYWLEGEETFLEVGGFNTFPVCVARYQVVGNETYAVGAGWYANDDVKMLQTLMSDRLRAVELMVKPPMQVSSSLAYNVNLIPGGITTTDNPNDVVKPLFDVNMQLGPLGEVVMETRENIKRCYNADLFLMLEQLDSGQMTAREVMERTQEKLQQLGPVVERLQYEFLNNVIERTYAILSDTKIFPPIPEELREILSDKEIKVDFTSPLAQAQKLAGLTTIEQAFGFAMNMMQVYPEVKAKINPIGLVNEYFKYLGAPAAMSFSDEETQAKLEEEQQAMMAQQEQMQQQQMLEQAPNLAKATKDMAEAANTNQSAVGNWLGMPGLGGEE